MIKYAFCFIASFCFSSFIVYKIMRSLAKSEFNDIIHLCQKENLALALYARERSIINYWTVYFSVLFSDKHMLKINALDKVRNDGNYVKLLVQLKQALSSYHLHISYYCWKVWVWNNFMLFERMYTMYTI